jgi:hypothetical protein
VLLPEIERQQEVGKEVVFRASAAFAKAEIYEVLEDDSGLLLVRELDERLELSALIAANIIGRPLA